MKNGDATLLMQTGVTKAGTKAVLTIFGLAITDFQEEKDYWTILRPSDSQGTTVTLNLKTDGHLELRKYGQATKIFSCRIINVKRKIKFPN